MIDLSKSHSWHLNLITFAGYRNTVDIFSSIGKLNTCGYYGYVLRSIFKIAYFSILTLSTSASTTIYAVLTLRSMDTSSTIIEAFKNSGDILSSHFAEQYGLAGAVFAALPLTLLTFLAVGVICVVLYFAVVLLKKLISVVAQFVVNRDFLLRILRGRSLPLTPSCIQKLTNTVFQ